MDQLPPALVALRGWPQFLAYKIVPSKRRPGKFDKIPISVRTGYSCDAHDVNHHVSVEDAIAFAQLAGPEYGVAFVLTRNDPFFFIDVDNAATPAGTWNDIARELLGCFEGAAVEVSTSGTGLHIIGKYRNAEPSHACKNVRLDIELYTSGRFVALTGWQACGHADYDHTEALYSAIERHWADVPPPPVPGAEPGASAWTTAPVPGSAPPESDEELIDRAIRSSSAGSAFGARASFADLWHARAEVLAECWPDEGRPYNASHADAALAQHLAFWTGNDCARIERLMRQSRLVRDKWDKHRSYMYKTITGACAGQTSWYSRPGPTMVEPDPEQAPGAATAMSLAEQINQRLREELRLDPEHHGDLLARMAANSEVIRQMINGAFWSGNKSKIFLLAGDHSLSQFVRPDAFEFLQRTFGSVVNRAAIVEAVELAGLHPPFDNAADQKRYSDACKLGSRVAGDVIIKYLMQHNQRESVEWRVDMFAERPRLEIFEDKARLVLAHKPFPETHEANPLIIQDYKCHFPRFDEFLMFCVMSRFASDRKKSYLWLYAPSDWGKGMLVQGVLKRMGITVETSVREIEAMFEGKPVGKSPEEFKRSFALVVDEFKTIKSEIKQLQNEITLSPKHQLSASVEIFAKIFMSAESVASLVTENGVEDQFANRMSIFEEFGNIEDRSLWQQSHSAYIDSLRAYVAQYFNREIARLRELGRVGAASEADQWLVDFHRRYGLDTKFERFSSALAGVAQDAIDWLHAQGFAVGGKLTREPITGVYYLLTPGALVDRFLDESFDRATVGGYRKRKADIMRLMSIDGEGAINYRINGFQKKAIKLKPPQLIQPMN